MEDKKLKTFIAKLMHDIGYKMSDVVLEQKHKDRMDYRLKANQTLPFFFVSTCGGYEYSINIGTESRDSKDFSVAASDGDVEADIYDALLPLIKKQFDRIRKYLEGQIVYSDANTSIVVRESILDDAYMTMYLNGDRFTASVKNGTVCFADVSLDAVEKFFEAVTKYLIPFYNKSKEK